MTTFKTDFPIFANYAKSHGRDLVYLDSAATTQKPASVIARLQEFYSTENANVHRGFYDLSETATESFEASRKIIADFLHTAAKNIVFTSGATQASNLLAQIFTNQLLKEPGVIISGIAEHNSNLLPWQRVAKLTNSQLLLAPLNADFQIDTNQILDWLKTYQTKVKVVALTGLSNVTGSITDIAKISAMVREYSPKALIIIDAAQLISHREVDLSKLDIDFLFASGHKLFAETGIGILWMKSAYLEQIEPPLLGGGMVDAVSNDSFQLTEIPNRFEAGTPNISGVISLAEAVKYLQTIGWIAIESRLAKLSAEFLERLLLIPNLSLLGSSKNEQRSAIFSIGIPGIHSHDLAGFLAGAGIAVRAGQHCNHLLHQNLGQSNWQQSGSLRASLHFYNDSSDLDMFAETLEEAIKIFQR